MSSPTPVIDEARPRREPLENLRAVLESFNALDLAATAGALELIPENAERTLRIQAFAHVAGTLPYRDDLPRISASRLRSVVNGPELGALAHGEDPFPNSFVEEVTYYGGSYAVFPGAMSGATFTFRHLCLAIFKEEGVPSYVAEEINRIILGSLRLSNTIAARAGLRRGTDPVPGPSSSIVIPDSHRLTAAKAAVTYSRQEMVGFFGEGDIDDRAWSRRTCLPGSLNLNEISFENSQLLNTPILQFGNTFVVSCPEALLAALNHHIIAIAIGHGARGSLVEAYGDANTSSVTRCMRYMDIYRVHVSIPGSSIPGSQERVFRCDSDKAIYAVVVPDQLRDFQPELASGGGEETDSLESNLSRRIKEVEQYLYCKLGLNGLLCLLVHAGVGRSMLLGLDDLTMAAVFQAFPANELETFALLNGGNRLALWRFAGEANRLRDEGVMVISSSPLDEFGLYRGRKNSFYLTDDEAPNVLTVVSDFSGSLRREVINIRDWHAVPHYEADGVIEVTTLHGKKEIPIYIPSAILTDRVGVFVDSLPFPLWILAPEKEDRSSDLRTLYAELASAMAYWLWQCSTWLNSNIINGPAPGRPTVINLLLANGQAWREVPPQIEERQAAEMISVTFKVDRRELDLTLQPGALVLFNRADNYGERECLKTLLRGICDLFGIAATISDADIGALVNDVAPLGIKKMLLVLNIDHLPQLDPRDIPHYRPMQEGDVDDVLRNLGTYLCKGRSLKPGPIATEQRNEVIKEAVGSCYRRLQALVASHQQLGFLEFLVSQHEAVVREDAFRRLTIPTRIACFESVGDVVRDLQEELPQIARTALASRFLIEYAIAQPPAGFRPISLGSYDEMRALADHIITFGRTSDALKYGLDDIQLAILKSGRLGRKGLTFHEASNSHMRQIYGEQIAKSSDGFGRNWPVPKANIEPNSVVLDLDSASSLEFGFTMTEISEFFGAVQVIGYEIGPGYSVSPLTEFVGRISRELEWAPHRVNEAVTLFSLGPRQDFLEPPSGFTKVDVYPWRFNRALSYVRRPLLLRNSGGGTQVLWGNRHVDTARENLLMLCFTGRLKATTDEMRQFLGKRQNQAGKDFNRNVADIVRGHVGTHVKERVKKIGHFRLANLGDIDVLALDAKRKQIVVIECKDLSVARTPHELATEVNELLHGSPGERSDIAKHQDIVSWVKKHVPDVVGLFGIQPTKNWKVASFLVVDQALMTAHLSACPVKVLTINQLKNEKFGNRRDVLCN